MAPPPKDTYCVIVTGSRDWPDPATVADMIRAASDYWGTSLTIMHGACPTGADHHADLACKQLGVAVERHPADWDRYGKSAGPRRNQHMVDLGADLVLAFPLPAEWGPSRGTEHCMRVAREAGITVWTFDPNTCRHGRTKDERCTACWPDDRDELSL